MQRLAFALTRRFKLLAHRHKLKYRDGHYVVRDFSKYLKQKNGRRALLSYRSQPVVDLLAGENTKQFSNDGAVIALARCLNETGYTVDIIDWDDVNPDLPGDYDLMIVHGGKNYDAIKSLRNHSGKLVYYSTGSYWKFHNRAEEDRFSSFSKRHGKILKHDRHIDAPEEQVNCDADLIIVLGNKDTAATYKGFLNVMSLEAASIAETRSVPIEDKDHLQTRMHFLFISGPGNIHKGLDLAIDYFLTNPKLHLHVMTRLDSDFEQYYADALHHTPNIHYHGFIPQRSRRFYEIVDMCSASILLSCSEGSPGSMIESMEQGLIPIITRTSHLDIGKAGVIIEDTKAQSIAKAIETIAAKSPNQLARMARNAKTIIRRKHQVSQYRDTIKMMLNAVMKVKR